MNFAELQAAIAAQNTLAKSLSAAQVDAKGNTAVSSAAAAGANSGAEGEEEDDGDGNGDLGDGSPMIKSFKLVLEDGTEMEAQDATEMVKCLVGEINKVKADAEAQSGELMKSLGGAVELIGTLTEGLKQTREDVLALAKRGDELAQTNALMAKSLGVIGNQGRGKRSVDVTLGARPNLNGNGGGAAEVKHTPTEILAKAQSALENKVITGTEATKVMTALNMGVQPEQAILDRILK
ncbi:hypothetical protein PQR39_35680 [Paraburkholderia sediminicola]|uniref:hypothetical protein n=1 Tax=Paraburkholderia sediminicola TaxID=458836 RepID=UPI0038BDEE67